MITVWDWCWPLTRVLGPDPLDPRPSLPPGPQAQDPRARPSVPGRPKTQDPEPVTVKILAARSAVTEKSVSLPPTNIAVRLRCVPECRENKVRLLVIFLAKKKENGNFPSLRVDFFRFLGGFRPKTQKFRPPAARQDPRPKTQPSGWVQDPRLSHLAGPKTQDPRPVMLREAADRLAAPKSD